MKVLITGKNGYIATNLLRWFKMRSSDYDVDVVSVKNGIPSSLVGYDVVIHLAAIVHQNEAKVGEQKYFEINRDLTIQLFEKSIKCGVSHFIFFSTMAVYGLEGSLKEKIIINEDTDYNPQTFYAKSKFEAEIHLLNNSDKMNVAILRPPMVYGEGCSGNYAKLEKLAKKISVFPYVNNERSVIHINNLCEIVRLIIKNESCGIFFPQDLDYANTSRLVQEIGLKDGRYIALNKALGIGATLLNTSLTRKIFGNLVYQKELSEHFNNKYIVKKNQMKNKNEKWDFKV